MHFRAISRLILVVVTLSLLAPLASTTAFAAYPGVSGRIAYTNVVVSPTGDPELDYDAIWTSNPDGSARKVVSNTGAPGVWPTDVVWSPDGKRLAFVLETSTSSGTINVINADGTGYRQLAEGTSPAWTPDGQWISYTVAGPENSWDSTFKVPVDGGDPVFVIDGSYLRWSPDGTRIAFERGWPTDVWVRDLNTDAETNITAERDLTWEYVSDWSPDGSKLLVTSDGEGPGTTLIVNGDGSLVRTLQISPAFNDITWSPDGSRIIYDNESFVVIRNDGTLDRTIAISGENPAWGSAPLLPVSDTRPNSCAGATSNSAQNTWLSEKINSSTDIDWFRFKLTARKRVQLTLGALPEDYRLDLFSTCSTLIASSSRSGRQFEEIVKTLPAGTYRVRVRGALSSGTAYRLRFRTLGYGLPVLSFLPDYDPGRTSDFVGEILNNTGSSRTKVRVAIRFYNSSGSLLASSTGSLGSYIIKPGGRAPFHFRGTAPLRTSRVTATVTSSYSTTTSPTTLTVTVNPTWTWDAVCKQSPADCPWYFDPDGNVIEEDLQTHYGGTIRNGHAYTVKSPLIAATFYDSLGKVIDAYYLRPTNTALDHLHPGQQTTWDMTFDTESLNRQTFVGRGQR